MPSSINFFYFLIKTKIKTSGWKWFWSAAFQIFCFELLWLIFLPFALIGHLLGYRRLSLHTWEVGHFAADIDSFLKEETLGFVSKKRWFITTPPARVANKQLLHYWRQRLSCVSGRLPAFLLEIMSRRWLMRKDLSRYCLGYPWSGTRDIYRVNKLWGERAPVLSLSKDDEEWAKDALANLGVKEGQWFVCVHVRERWHSSHVEAVQGYRNANIVNVIPAMQEIVRRGGVCIRMGDADMDPLPEIPGVIDYAKHPMKSDRLDLVLCAKAKFFLGCTSGLFFLSMIFGVPVALSNMIPVATLAVRPVDLSIPKLLWSNSLERYLCFEEIMHSKAKEYVLSQQYEEAHIRVDENSADDILAMTLEMLDRLEGRFVVSAEDEHLHSQYMALFQPGDFSYGAASRVSLAFLRRHSNLLKKRG